MAIGRGSEIGSSVHIHVDFGDLHIVMMAILGMV